MSSARVSGGPAPGRKRAHRLIAAPTALLLGAALCGCGDASSTRPPVSTPLAVQVGVAAAAPGAPVVGVPDTLRLDLRGVGGELLVHPALLELGADVPSFHLSLPAPAGSNRSLTVMMLGARSVLRADGARLFEQRGILYYEKVTGIDIQPGLIRRIDARVRLFVPRFGAVEYPTGGGFRIHWNRIAGADRYLLTRLDPQGAVRDSTVFDTTYAGRLFRTTFRVRAVDLSGLTSPASDELRVDSPAPGVGANRLSSSPGTD